MAAHINMPNTSSVFCGAIHTRLTVSNNFGSVQHIFQIFHDLTIIKMRMNRFRHSEIIGLVSDEATKFRLNFFHPKSPVNWINCSHPWTFE